MDAAARPRLRRCLGLASGGLLSKEGPLRVRLYVGGTVLFAIAAVLVAVLLGHGHAVERPWLLGLFAVLIALENVRSIRVRKGQQGESYAHEEALLVFTVLLFPPLAALAAFAVGVVVGQLAAPRGRLKVLFNIAQFIASAALAVTIVGVLAPGEDLGAARVLAVLAGVLVFSLANRVAVKGVLAAAGVSAFRDNLLDDLRGDCVTWAGVVSIGLLAGLVGISDPWALPFALAGLVALSVALSGRVRAQHDRQALAEIVDSSAAAIFSVDSRGVIRAWNPEMERVTGYAASEAGERALADVVQLRNADGGAANDLMSASHLSEPHERRLIQLEAASGGDRWLMLSRASLPDGGFAFVAQDVTEQREAEQALIESEDRLRLALEAGHMGWWEWDLATDSIRWSESLEQLNGLAPGSFGGTYADFLATIHPDDRDAVAGTTASALSDGERELVYRIVRPDGAVRWIEDMGKVVRNADGQPIKMIGVERDITERKRAEALSALQRQILEEIAAGAPLTAVLECLVHLVEAQSEGVLGSVLLLDEEAVHLRHGAGPSLPDAYNEAVDGIAIGPQAGSCGTAAYRREPVVVSDIASDPLWAEARDLALGHSLRACWSTPLVGSDGDVLGTFAMYYRDRRQPTALDLELIDVASHVARIAIERARQERRLVETEEKYQRRVEQLPLAVYAFTPADRGTELRAQARYMSPQVEAMLGYSPEEWQDDPDLFIAIVHPEDRDRMVAEVRRARALGDRFRGEYRMLAKDGRVVWVHDESVYLRDPEGKVVAVEGFLIDVSERKELESDLLQAQKMDAVGQLAGGVAHDFNNMMSAVVGFSELVLARLEETHAVRPQIEEIKRAGERASEMTHQLLAFSRKQMLQPRVLDVNVVAAEAEKLLRRLIGEDVDLVSVLDPELEPVEADPGQLEQVLMNLAVNARDAMPMGGKLTIETSNVYLAEDYAAAHVEVVPGPYVLLAVSDTGAGMDANTQARIFEPFFTTKEKGEGTGLGLATVFGIVKQSGGHISVYSELGRGTTFKVYLPQAKTLGTSSQRDPAHEQTRPGRETILLAEDEELVRNLGREALEQHGYKVLEAHSGLHALELAQNHDGRIHLLLTDVVMPGLSGPELADRLAPLRPDMKVLYASGYADEAIVRHGVLGEGIAFLPKPLTPTSLARKVRDVLDEAPAYEAEP